MAKHLVIVESPTKARTMTRYLGPDYVIEASMGHVRDLPEKEFGVDIEHDFAPTYEVSDDKRKVIATLRKLSAEADVVYLAPDPDREGEAIAWHLKEALKLPAAKARRVTFDEFTKSAILRAFQEPGVIRMDLVNAQQARRILDRIVGYKISPVLWKRVQKGLSAGRVQSVAVRIIVDREKEIRAFEARPLSDKEYWTIKAVFSRKDRMKETFDAELRLSEKKELKTEQDATAIRKQVAEGKYFASSVEQKEVQSKAPPPFSTDLLLRQASNQLGFSARVTSRTAQQLYEGMEVGSRGTVGLITYMRTDSFHLSAQAVAAARDFIGATYGKPYVPAQPNIYASSAGAQEAHEAVRPTDVTLTPEGAAPYLTHDQQRLYQLIWNRFVACQMPPARYKNTVVEIPAGDRVFVARGKEQLFDGYTRVLGRLDKDQILPALHVGDELHRHDLVPEQHFEQPPLRYTEATLIGELKKQGIGRPSTYATILTTIQGRKYVVLKEEEDRPEDVQPPDQDEEEKQPQDVTRKKKRKKFHPTDLGEVVTDKLVEHFPTVLDVAFTSHMEEDLDKIAEAKADWIEVLKEFNGPFEKDLAKASKEMKSAQKPSAYTCPKCSKPVVYKLSRGSWFLACSGYPKCRFAASVDADGKMIEKEEPKLTDFDCPACGQKMVLRDGKWGKFFSCSTYPKCKKTMQLGPEGKPIERAEAEKTDVTCPKCGSPMLKKFSKRGPFLACSAYPKCKSTMNIGPDGKITSGSSGEPTEFKCPKCQSPIVKKTGKRGPFYACSGFPKCRTTMNIGPDGQPIAAKRAGTRRATGAARETAPQAAAAPTDTATSEEKCPECGGPMVRRSGKRGWFLGCAAYPKCKGTKPLAEAGASAPQTAPQPTDHPCPNCGKMMVVREGKWGKFLACSGYPKCKTTKKLGPDGEPLD